MLIKYVYIISVVKENKLTDISMGIKDDVRLERQNNLKRSD